MIKTPTRRIFAAVVITALFSLSCTLPFGLGNKIRKNLEETTSTEQKSLPAVTATAKTTDTEAATKNTGTIITGVDTDLPDSYRMTFTASSAGADAAGTPITLSVQMESEIDNLRSVRHTRITIEGSGAAAQTGDVEIFQQNEQSYLYNGDNTDAPCLSIGTAGDLLSSPAMNPDNFLVAIEIGDLLESNISMNEIPADHYRVENSLLDLENTHFESGEVWLARSGGYIVRFTGQAQGQISDGTRQGTGTIQWDYNLYDANRISEIIIPEACFEQQASLGELPIPGNAVNKLSFSGIITFDSPEQPEKVSTFYRIKLPAQDWVLTEQTNTAGVLMLTFEKDSESLQIMITPKTGDGSSVIITSIAMQ